MLLLALLRQRGVISDLPTPAGPIADELSRYDAHMRDARGLSAATRTGRLRIVQRLRFGQRRRRAEIFRRVEVSRSLLRAFHGSKMIIGTPHAKR